MTTTYTAFSAAFDRATRNSKYDLGYGWTLCPIHLIGHDKRRSCEACK